MQDDIAASIARALEVSVGADSSSSRRRPKSDQAYDAYLRGLYVSEHNDVDGLATAVAYYRQALDIDPTFTDAAVQLAFAYYGQANQGMVSADIGYDQARRAVESALKLDPTTASHTPYSGRFTQTMTAIGQQPMGSSSGPGPSLPTTGMFSGLSAQLPLALGQDAAARQLYREALAYDRLLPPAYMMLAYVEERSGHWSEAEAADRRLLEVSPTYHWGHVELGLELLMLGARDR